MSQSIKANVKFNKGIKCEVNTQTSSLFLHAKNEQSKKSQTETSFANSYKQYERPP